MSPQSMAMTATASVYNRKNKTVGVCMQVSGIVIASQCGWRVLGQQWKKLNRQYQQQLSV